VVLSDCIQSESEEEVIEISDDDEEEEEAPKPVKRTNRAAVLRSVIMELYDNVWLTIVYCYIANRQQRRHLPKRKLLLAPQNRHNFHLRLLDGLLVRPRQRLEGKWWYVFMDCFR